MTLKLSYMFILQSNILWNNMPIRNDLIKKYITIKKHKINSILYRVIKCSDLPWNILLILAMSQYTLHYYPKGWNKIYWIYVMYVIICNTRHTSGYLQNTVYNKNSQKVHFFTFRNFWKIFELYKCDWLPTKTRRSMALFLLSSITDSAHLHKTYIFIILMPKSGPNLGSRY